MPDAVVVNIDERTEFSFLASDAAAVGRERPLPSLRRVRPSAATSALRWGSGAAEVVLAHGAALNAHTWDSTLLAWAGRDDFLALDLPGHGDSSWRADADYSPAALAPALEDSLAAAAGSGWTATRPALVGHSLGGLIALQCIRDAQPSFGRLVLVDILPLAPEAARTVASFLDGPRSFASREEIVERALAFGLGGGSRAKLERGVFLNTRISPDGHVIWKHHFGQLGGRAMAGHGSDLLWEAIVHSDVPIDLVVASQSIVDADTLARFTALRPDARVVRVPGSHNLQETSPVELAQVLQRLVAAG